MKKLAMPCVLLALLTLPAMGSESGITAAEPKAVNIATEMLLKKVTVRLATRMSEAIPFLSDSVGLPMSIAQEDADIEVTLATDRITLGEVLRKLKDATKLEYRVAGGAIQFATAERFANIDAGKTKYTPSTASDKGYGYKYIWTDDRGFNIVLGDKSKLSDERLALMGLSKPITFDQLREVLDGLPSEKTGADAKVCRAHEARAAMLLLKQYAFYPETQTVGEALGRIEREEQRSNHEITLICSKSVGDHPLKLGTKGQTLLDILKQTKTDTGCVVRWETKDPEERASTIRVGSKDELAQFDRDAATFVVWNGTLPEPKQPPTAIESAEDKK